MIDELRAQRAGADPGAAGELEVFREPAVEQKPWLGSSGSTNFSASPIL